MYLREIFDRERENFMMLILTLFTYILIKQFDIQKLKEVVSILVIYIVWILLNYWVGKMITLRRIKIKPSKEYLDEKLDSLADGKKWYGFLDVEIPKKWIINDCYVTLERIAPIYYGDRILFNGEFSEWLSDVNKPEYKMLHWRSPLSYQNGSKINIGENSQKESFSLGKIVTGKFGNLDINTFNFDVQQKNPREIDFKKFGLYEFTIKFHWKKYGRDMIPKKVDGYIYSRSKNGVREIRVGVGNYQDDSKIPKPQQIKGD